jgi:hypothetical protein
MLFQRMCDISTILEKPTLLNPIIIKNSLFVVRSSFLSLYIEDLHDLLAGELRLFLLSVSSSSSSIRVDDGTVVPTRASVKKEVGLDEYFPRGFGRGENFPPIFFLLFFL